jgi:hypothetical protein
MNLGLFFEFWRKVDFRVITKVQPIIFLFNTRYLCKITNPPPPPPFSYQLINYKERRSRNKERKKNIKRGGGG